MPLGSPMQSPDFHTVGSESRDCRDAAKQPGGPGLARSVLGHLLLLGVLFHWSGRAQTPPPTIEDSAVEVVVLDDEQHAAAPVAAPAVNGVDKGTPGAKGGMVKAANDPGVSDPPKSQTGEAVKPGSTAKGGDRLLVGPVGWALAQQTAPDSRGHDEVNGVKEQEFGCGKKASSSLNTSVIEASATVDFLMSDRGQIAQLIRDLSRRNDHDINKNYQTLQRANITVIGDVSLIGERTRWAAVAPGLQVKEGDIVKVRISHVDPDDPCQWIPTTIVGPGRP